MRRCSVLLLLSSLLGSIQGCAQPANPGPGQTGPLTAEVLHNATQCGGGFLQPTVLYKSFTKTRVSNLPAAGFIKGRDKQKQPAQPQTPAVPAVDFTSEGVLFISMGQRPTVGYSLSFVQGWLRLKSDILEVKVIWLEPPPGYRQAQMLTEPCMLLKIPAVPFQHIHVVDQEGKVRISTTR
jgi:hypothetical protein